MPEGGDIGFYSNWKDGPRWQDFHLRELPRILERLRRGRRRAIAGLSMGGLGAMDYAARRPRMFRGGGVVLRRPAPARRPALLARAVLAATPRTRRDVWGDPDSDRATWRRHDPTSLLPALKGLPLFVSAGDGRGAERDAIEAEVGAERARSRAARGRSTSRSTPTSTRAGTHDWPYWQRELHRALPLLLGPLR